jgi:Asp-tRNA(Asn)/Glu-tRNA(Gln) amidotransferase A subunit family amidase
LKLATEIFFQSHQLDPSAAPLPFNESAYQDIISGKRKGLKIGYFDSLPLFPSSDAMRRAINIAKVKLEREGHILVPFKITKEEHALMTKIFIASTCIAFVG